MKPLIAITMGDPAGIGPEIIAAAWSREDLHDQCRAVVIGHPEWMRRAIQHVGADITVVEIDSPEQARCSARRMPCIPCSDDGVLQVRPGQVDARGGQAAYDAITYAGRLAMAEEVDAITTAPLNKAALVAAGHDYPGHTELLAELCAVSHVAMMLYLSPGVNVAGRVGLGVAHVTLHTAMHDVFAQLTVPRIVQTARLAHVVMNGLLDAQAHTESARIGVCALNPHGGEHGLFGDEETQVIRPAVEQGQGEGLALEGPLPADTLFAQAAEGRFDGVVAMYHDQGHIALKLLGMYRAVNVTLGLPIVRTSVAHGTAFDLAWKQPARCEGMIEAIRVAARLVQCKDQLRWQ